MYITQWSLFGRESRSLFKRKPKLDPAMREQFQREPRLAFPVIEVPGEGMGYVLGVRAVMAKRLADARVFTEELEITKEAVRELSSEWSAKTISLGPDPYGIENYNLIMTVLSDAEIMKKIEEARGEMRPKVVRFDPTARPKRNAL